MENVETTEQPMQDSVEDRIADFLAPPKEQPEVEQEAATQETETEPETFEFEYEGEKFPLPKKLEKAVMQEKDYTQKSQTLAERQRDVERQFAQIKLAQAETIFTQSVKAETDQIGMIDAVLGEYKNLKWQDMTTDDLVRKKLEMDQYKDMRTVLDQQVQAKKAQFEQARDQEIARLKAEATDTLKKRVNWTDQTEAEVRSYVKELGITDTEYDSVFDPRHKQILWEAAQYRKTKSQAAPAVQQIKSVKTKSSDPMPQSVRDKLAYSKAIKAAPNLNAKSELATARLARIFEG